MISLLNFLESIGINYSMKCALYDNPVKLIAINRNEQYPIVISTSSGVINRLDKFGRLNEETNCLIYPINFGTWEEEIRYKCNKGKYITIDNFIGVVEKWIDSTCVKCQEVYDIKQNKIASNNRIFSKCIYSDIKLSTPEEKKLFNNKIASELDMEFNEITNELQFIHEQRFKRGAEIIHGTNGKTVKIDKYVKYVGYYTTDEECLSEKEIEDYFYVADKLNFNTGDIIETDKGVFVYNPEMNKFFGYNCSFGVVKHNDEDKWVCPYCIHESDNPHLVGDQSLYRLYEMIAKQLEKKMIIPISEECLKRMTSELLMLPYTIDIYPVIVDSFVHWYKNNTNNVENGDVSSIIKKTIEFIELNFPNAIFNTEDIINNYKKFVLE